MNFFDDMELRDCERMSDEIGKSAGLGEKMTFDCFVIICREINKEIIRVREIIGNSVRCRDLKPIDHFVIQHNARRISSGLSIIDVSDRLKGKLRRLKMVKKPEDAIVLHGIGQTRLNEIIDNQKKRQPEPEDPDESSVLLREILNELKTIREKVQELKEATKPDDQSWYEHKIELG